MASLKVEICLKKKTHPSSNFSVTFLSKVGTKKKQILLSQNLRKITAPKNKKFSISILQNIIKMMA